MELQTTQSTMRPSLKSVLMPDWQCFVGKYKVLFLLFCFILYMCVHSCVLTCSCMYTYVTCSSFMTSPLYIVFPFQSCISRSVVHFSNLGGFSPPMTTLNSM